jgi:protein-S-isoprenylcysteine O-methyltransferase Ste14
MRVTTGGGAGWIGRGARIAGWLGLMLFGALERAVRQPGSASDLGRDERDRGTTATIVGAYGLALGLPLLLRLPMLRSVAWVQRLPKSAAVVGAAVEAIGLGLRAWSMQTLGAAYSRTLRVEGHQAVIDRGPYRLVRHPGYLGSILVWTGFAVTSRNGVTVALVVGPLAAAYRRRILVEEALLARDLPGYADYRRRSWRLLPFAW